MISSSSVCPMSVISSPSFPPPTFPSKTPFVVLSFLMAGRVWWGADPPVFSCLCPWAFLTGHLWKQGSGFPEFLVWSVAALSVISSIWLCLVRTVNKCDLLSATSQTEGSASLLHQPLLLFWLSKLKVGRSFSFWACHRAVSRDFIGNCPFCLRVADFLFWEALLTYCLTAPASRARACEQSTRVPQPLLWFLPPSAFSHVKTVGSGFPAFHFCLFLEQKWETKIKLLMLLSWLKRRSWLLSSFFAFQSLVLNSSVEV